MNPPSAPLDTGQYFRDQTRSNMAPQPGTSRGAVLWFACASFGAVAFLDNRISGIPQDVRVLPTGFFDPNEFGV
jgi:hypothetical protein